MSASPLLPLDLRIDATKSLARLEQKMDLIISLLQKGERAHTISLGIVKAEPPKKNPEGMYVKFVQRYMQPGLTYHTDDLHRVFLASGEAIVPPTAQNFSTCLLRAAKAGLILKVPNKNGRYALSEGKANGE